MDLAGGRGGRALPKEKEEIVVGVGARIAKTPCFCNLQKLKFDVFLLQFAQHHRIRPKSKSFWVRNANFVRDAYRGALGVYTMVFKDNIS